MSPSLIGASGVVILFALLILRVPVWISLILVGFFGNAIALGWPGTQPGKKKLVEVMKPSQHLREHIQVQRQWQRHVAQHSGQR